MQSYHCLAFLSLSSVLFRKIKSQKVLLNFLCFVGMFWIRYAEGWGQLVGGWWYVDVMQDQVAWGTAANLVHQKIRCTELQKFLNRGQHSSIVKDDDNMVAIVVVYCLCTMCSCLWARPGRATQTWLLCCWIVCIAYGAVGCRQGACGAASMLCCCLFFVVGKARATHFVHYIFSSAQYVYYVVHIQCHCLLVRPGQRACNAGTLRGTPALLQAQAQCGEVHPEESTEEIHLLKHWPTSIHSHCCIRFYQQQW